MIAFYITIYLNWQRFIAIVNDISSTKNAKKIGNIIKHCIERKYKNNVQIKLVEANEMIPSIEDFLIRHYRMQDPNILVYFLILVLFLQW